MAELKLVSTIKDIVGRRPNSDELKRIVEALHEDTVDTSHEDSENTKKVAVQNCLYWINKQAEHGAFNTTLPPGEGWFDSEEEAMSCALILSEKGYKTEFIKRLIFNEWRVKVLW